MLQGLKAPLKVTVFARESEFPRFRERLPEYQYVSKQVSVEYVDPDKHPALAQQMQIQTLRHDRHRVRGAHRARDRRLGAGHHQRHHQGRDRPASRRCTSRRGTARRTPASSERDGYNGIATRSARDNYKVDKLVLAQQGEVPDDATIVVVAGPRTDFLPPEIEALKRYLAQGRQAAADDRPAGQAPTRRRWRT